MCIIDMWEEIGYVVCVKRRFEYDLKFQNQPPEYFVDLKTMHLLT